MVQYKKPPVRSGNIADRRKATPASAAGRAAVGRATNRRERKPPPTGVVVNWRTETVYPWTAKNKQAGGSGRRNLSRSSRALSKPKGR